MQPTTNLAICRRPGSSCLLPGEDELAIRQPCARDRRVDAASAAAAASTAAAAATVDRRRRSWNVLGGNAAGVQHQSAVIRGTPAIVEIHRRGGAPAAATPAAAHTDGRRSAVAVRIHVLRPSERFAGSWNGRYVDHHHVLLDWFRFAATATTATTVEPTTAATTTPGRFPLGDDSLRRIFSLQFCLSLV